MEEERPLHDEQSSTEILLNSRSRKAPRIRQGLAVGAALALAGAAVLAVLQVTKSATQLPAREISTHRAFLTEVAVEADSAPVKHHRESDDQVDKLSKHKDQAEAATKLKDEAQQALQQADKLVDQAKSLKQHSDTLNSDAKGLEEKTSSLKKEASERKDSAEKNRQDADKARSAAEESRQKALGLLENARKEARDITAEAKKKAAELLEEARQKSKDLSSEASSKATQLDQNAKDLDAKGVDLDKEAVKNDGEAKNDEQRAEKTSQKASSVEKKAKEEKQNAIDAEEKAQQDVASHRMCIGLPGVKLKGGSPVTFDPVVGEHQIEDDWQCNDWCLKHADCKQSVFVWETKSCELFTEASVEPLSFRDIWPWFNSSYCDTLDGKQNMLDMLHKVYEAKPWVPPIHNCSWAGDNCIHTGCCADVCDASWDFKECKYYTCYKRDENWAGCKTGGPPADWDGTKLGGHENGEVAPAPDGKLIQGTRLYCFSVVMWNQPPEEGWMDSEGQLANHWKEENKGIMQCDDYSLFDGLEGGSVHNIQSFIQAWNKVKDDGRWKRNDWSIKVDPDAVFFPDHFRKKIQWVYKTPQGAALYMRNTNYKFKFLGAFEALTREALEVYFQRGWECEAHLGQQGGEDYWLLQCLEGLGMNFQTDVALLHDKYAEDENCGDPNGVAHHFFKKIEGGDGWENCWNTANDAWNSEHPQ